MLLKDVIFNCTYVVFDLMYIGPCIIVIVEE